ncbi:hypothetical protein BC939DRAFT_473594 [Gamsiella multidivaricata]|uniref:uncharacterized protein n=1 Tax=Gamsiella multidivaricata TaxID=101098 RepID=UPI00221E6B72|nr:uncharacterized protein BC939DRAFT_473594 [Gamsiella multidivaricata]KAG0369926.1 Potassium channel [Gamsiella multidivaricata]KAI7830363.1 hypothetical protein BC939DRAFT_473594 [Gamsiella multidivaricata]
MWNPPPPDLQINIKRPPSTTRPKSQGVNGHTQSNNVSPRISLSNDQNHAIINSYHGHHNGANDDNNRPPNDTSGNSLPHRLNSMNRPTITVSLPQPRLEKVGPYLAIATLQAYTVLTVVRCLADPAWIVNRDKNAPSDANHMAEIGSLEKVFLACAIAMTMLSCLGVTLRILDKLPWLRRISVVTAYLEAAFCIAALISFLSTHKLPPGSQFSHGFLACVITSIFASIVAIMLTVDWWRGFPSAGLSATLKALIISSFVMTTVIIVGAAIYSSLEDWTFDEAVNFCIVSFATIGYGNLSPKTPAGQIIFFIYGLFGISSLGFFVVSLRNAVIEQFQWRLVDRFSKPAHITRVQTRMSAKDISFPEARFEEERRVKMMVKRKMMFRMVCIWIVMWFGGAGVFCAFEPWTYLESLYFCFVTLTTIGFGDYVPTEPGAIEFWNVYVFVGLAVFAYILSLSSESMATQIHLVDDQDEDDDDMYGWERNEDPNAPLTTRSGILGLEGLKWLHHQHQLQQQGSSADIQLDEAGKPISNISHLGSTMPNLGDDGSFDGEQSTQSTMQRNRNRRKGSTGRILTVSAKERKQMLQAEYYATHSLPTTIRFVDTKGMPHQKTIRPGDTRDSISGPGGADTTSDQPAYTYDTVGYYGTIGRSDRSGIHRGSSLRDQQNLIENETLYGTRSMQPLNTAQTGNQRLIRFARPNRTVDGATGWPGGDALRTEPGFDGRRESGSGYIPSCMDVFRQNNQQSGAGESSPWQGSNSRPAPQGESVARVRSKSWDQSANQQRLGPSQNDIHRWLAEDAGTLEGPDFSITHRPSEEHLGASISADQTRPRQSNDVTRVINPLWEHSGDPSQHSKRVEGDDKGRLGLTREERRHQRGEIAPDEIPIPLTDEPGIMDASEEARFRAGQDVSHGAAVSRTTSQPPVQGPITPITLVHEPTLPLNNEETSSASNIPDNLFLGGGAGAGYGLHAYGVPQSGSKSELEAGLEARSNIDFQRPMTPTSGPTQLMENEDNGRQLTVHASNSRSRSLFSNHPRSGQSSAMHSPTGSAQHSRPSSVLMTIFDEPTNLSKSRTASRASSVSGPQHRTRNESSNDLYTGEGDDNSSGTRPPLGGPARSDISIGPFDEVRNPDLIPHFDDDVDLNHAELNPQQVDEEHRMQEQLRRREREIEARLATLRGKGRGDYA